jgi:hypothetical protein
MSNMHHAAERIEIVPRVVVDRRHAADRRASWRGGRRDTDWINRPQGEPAQVERGEHWFWTWRPWVKRSPRRDEETLASATRT